MDEDNYSSYSGEIPEDKSAFMWVNQVTGVITRWCSLQKRWISYAPILFISDSVMPNEMFLNKKDLENDCY